ncbi:MAG TPA: succinate dehydrogenase [Rubricoccaceae bacterium]|jgi:succinate dehydrogenase / fumarate reductase membrane anchor subunit
MATTYGRNSQSSAFQWFSHRITGTFLVFLLVTHFWVQHFDRVTASVSHSVISGAEAETGELPQYSEEAEGAVRAARARTGQPPPVAPRAVPVALQPGLNEGTAPGPTHPPAETDAVTPYDVLMLRLGDPVYAVLWKGFNLLFLLFALHHGFYGLNNIITDYVRNDLLRVGISSLSWTVALVLFVIGAYSVVVAGL